MPKLTDTTRCAAIDLHLTLRLADDRLADLRFEGQGCAISVASASLMSEAVKGRSRAEVERLYGEVHAMLTGRSQQPPAQLGKLAALAGVAEFPARVKCASLAGTRCMPRSSVPTGTVSTE